MSLKMHLTTGLGVGLVFLAPRIAQPCSPPPSVWAIEGANISDGGQIGPEGPFLLVAKGAYDEGYTYHLAGALNLDVTCDDQPVEGTLTVQDPQASWTPSAPLTLGSQCSFHVRLESEETRWLPESEREKFTLEATYNVEVREPLPLVAPDVQRARAYTWLKEEKQCVEPPENRCGPCMREEVVQQSLHARLEVDLARPDRADASSYIGQIKVAPTQAQVEGRDSGIRSALLHADMLPFSIDLGERNGWPQGQICFQVEWLREGELPVGTEIQCLEVQIEAELPEEPPEEPADGGVQDTDAGPEEAPKSSSGCATQPEGGFDVSLWWLLGLPLLRRRRAR